MPTSWPPDDVAVRRPSGERVTSSERGAILRGRAAVTALVLAVILSGAVVDLSLAQPLYRASAIPLFDLDVPAWSADPKTEWALKSGDPGTTGEAAKSGVIQQLRLQYAEIQRHQDTFGTTLGARHPALQPAGASATRPNSSTVPY